MALRALPHLTLEVRFLCDVYDLPPIVAFLSEFPAAKSIKEIGGDARLGAPCCEEDQKQEYTVPQLRQLAELCPDLESLELAGPRYAEAKVQDCLGVVAEHLSNLRKLECNFSSKAVLQPDFAEAVLAFCAECAKRPSCNPDPLVVSIGISGPEQEVVEFSRNPDPLVVAELRGLKKTWRTRNASLAGKQREVELHVHCGGEDGESSDN